MGYKGLEIYTIRLTIEEEEEEEQGVVYLS